MSDFWKKFFHLSETLYRSVFEVAVYEFADDFWKKNLIQAKIWALQFLRSLNTNLIS